MKTYKLFTAAALLAMVGCHKSLEYRDVVYFTGTESSPLSSMYVDGPTTKSVTVTASDVVKSEVKVPVSVDFSAVERYNAINGTEYQMLPEGSYSLDSDSFTITPGNNISAPVNFSITSMDDFEEGVLYCLPLKIGNASNGWEALAPSQTALFVIKQIITTEVMNLNRSTYFNMKSMEKNPDLANLSAVTMEARVKMDGWSNLGHKIATVMGIEEHFVIRFGDGSIDKNQLQIAGRGVSFTSADHFDTGKWYHIVGIDDGSNIRLYVDGKLQFSGDSSGKSALDMGATAEGGGFRIGASAGDIRPLPGCISEVRVWKRALSILEAENNQCYINPENAQDLIGYWRMDTMEDGMLPDLSGNGYHGTPNNTPAMVDGVKCPYIE